MRIKCRSLARERNEAPTFPFEDQAVGRQHPLGSDDGSPSLVMKEGQRKSYQSHPPERRNVIIWKVYMVPEGILRTYSGDSSGGGP